MRRYYVLPFEVMHAHRDLYYNRAGTHWVALYDASKPGDKERWEADGKPVLLSATFSSEAAEDKFHGHPDVAILPDHVQEGRDKLSASLARPARKVKERHVQALSALGLTANDTVLDVEGKAIALNKAMRLSSVL